MHTIIYLSPVQTCFGLVWSGLVYTLDMQSHQRGLTHHCLTEKKTFKVERCDLTQSTVRIYM